MSRAGTWPESVFMYHANISRLLFFGLSMSDPNLRRWLALSQQQSNDGHVLRGGRESLPHLWMTKLPDAQATREPTWQSLTHLGVRTAWLNDWQHITDALENVIGLFRRTSADQPPQAD